MTDRLVLILFNEPGGTRCGAPAAYAESDAGVLREVDAVAGALRTLGIPYREAAVQDLRDVNRALAICGVSCVVNLVESLEGSGAGACMVPAVCEAAGKPWTGNGTECQLLALDKWLSKCALQSAGVPTPFGIVVPPGTPCPSLPPGLGSVIVKPLCTDGSEGIDADSVVPVEDLATLRRRVQSVHTHFALPALVESYLAGREFNVSLLEEAGTPTVLPLAEIDFSAFGPGRPRIVDYRAKWIENSFEFAHTPRRVPADIDEDTARALRSVAVDAWTCLKCRDYARVDIRLDAQGAPSVIEVNPNPDISADAGFSAALLAGGFAFSDFVAILLSNAGWAADVRTGVSGQGQHAHDPNVRRSAPADRQPILSLLARTGVFRDCELDIAREVLDDALSGAEHGHYQSLTATRNGAVAGWICFGPTPCTVGAFDLYWLAVTPDRHRTGIGAALLARAEDRIRVSNGRLAIVETSARPDYETARHFYAHHGYRHVATVPDFYEPGDDKLIYLKELDRSARRPCVPADGPVSGMPTRSGHPKGLDTGRANC